MFIQPLPRFIVSVQASGNEPLNQPEHLSAMAHSVLNGGAQGLRMAQPHNIAHFRKTTNGMLPFIVGLTKPEPLPQHPETQVYITATTAQAVALIQAGANWVALDATARPRPQGETLSQIIQTLKTQYPHIGILADCAQLEDAVSAVAMGADAVATTLSGYTQETLETLSKAGEPQNEPDFALLQAMLTQLQVPVVCEGRITRPEQAVHALRLGAQSVIVGSAITRPQCIAQSFQHMISFV